MMRAERAVKELLLALGEDVDREGLKETPRRMAAMLTEMCHREPFKFTSFKNEGINEMIVQTPIEFHSLCEHHLAPFTGVASVCYIPDGRIVGLSKLARTVAYCAKGLQNQERICTAIADMLEENLHPQGVGVILRAQHSCMALRGVKSNPWTTTSCMRGVLLTKPEARAEFLALVRS
ncbi:MAG: GTP cyclohydrolase I [Candidatus Paceibacterota bacterium]|jgi:GTP cyclohydrolase I